MTEGGQKRPDIIIERKKKKRFAKDLKKKDDRYCKNVDQR